MSQRSEATAGHRIDITERAQAVHVSVDGITLAVTDRPVVLSETGLPPRYYFRPEDIRTELLVASTHQTSCPFKGEASYWSVDTGTAVFDDIVWSYRTPIPEAEQIAGLFCFYNEKVDIDVDGQRLERPRTRWS